MTSIRPFEAMDVFKFNTTNLDPLTETYDLNFYFTYLARWPHLFNVAVGAEGQIQAYVMGKLESSPSYLSYTQPNSPHILPWHAHITALTVAPSARRLGLARTLSDNLATAAEEYDAWFVDLFVRKSNAIAQELYRGMGYKVFRRVLDYYSDDLSDPTKDGEDAFDMRLRLRRDKTGKHERENGEDFPVTPEDVW
ncbi:n-acetyltransferase [Phlyctema vagabunda]|uniref:N-acetyltransferase n=1 Tax=Phlyctema vagabunda TaxID=108571 RepID=A0ABR4P952_9HELO